MSKRIAVWRMGARFITSEDSTVGGGRIAEAVLKAIRAAGHTPVVVSRVKEASRMWLDLHKFECVEEWVPTDYDEVCLLTGPSNPMYDALYTTYDRIASFEGPVLYAWYDAALGFEFDPQKKWSKFRARSDVTTEDLFRNKKWTVLGQSAVPHEDVSFQRCVWELAEAAFGKVAAPHASPKARFGYFGSPRSGRIREMKRWFGGGGLPLDLYGKSWKTDALDGDVNFCGDVKERMVRKRLNTYAATLYAADPIYVKTDFIAQRFIENAMAGVAVAYSDKIQPTIRELISDKWVFSEVAQMQDWFEQMTADNAARAATIKEQQQVVFSWVEAHPASPTKAISAIL